MSARSNRNEPAPDDLIGLSEAARLLPSIRPGRKVHVSTLARWILSGRLRGWRRGRFLLVSKSDVEALARPVEVELRPEAASELERRRRDAETDRILREAGIRR